jgi:hypothetical protein
MAVIDTDRVVTVAQLVDELRISVPTARGLVEGLGVIATINRTSFYDREDVKAVLRERHDNLLQFLGVLSPEDSYDGNVIASMEASLDEL